MDALTPTVLDTDPGIDDALLDGFEPFLNSAPRGARRRPGSEPTITKKRFK